MFKWAAIVCFLTCTHQVTLAADDYWMEFPYGNNDFNYQVKFGDNISMSCNDTFMPPEYVMKYWIRSDLRVMFPGDIELFYTLDGNAGWEVDNTTGDMLIIILQESQFGFYHCVMENPSDSTQLYVVKKALNYEEAYFGNLWDLYEMNTIIGLSVAGGFALICICAMLICKFQVSSDDVEYNLTIVKDFELEDQPEGSSVDKSDIAGIKASSEFDNIAFEVDHEYEKDYRVTSTTL